MSFATVINGKTVICIAVGAVLGVATPKVVHKITHHNKPKVEHPVITQPAAPCIPFAANGPIPFGPISNMPLTSIPQIDQFGVGLPGVTAWEGRYTYIIKGLDDEPGRTGPVGPVSVPQTPSGPPSAGTVPEPKTWSMMVIGFAVVGYSFRIQKKKETLKNV